MIFSSDYLTKDFNIFINSGSVYSANDYSNVPPDVKIANPDLFVVPQIKQNYLFNMIVGDDTTSNTVIEPECSQETQPTLKFKTRYAYTVTQSDYDSTSDIIIQLPEVISDPQFIIVNSNYGQMTYGDHYVLQNNGSELLIKKDSVDVTVGMIIELYVYAYLGDAE
jgi:hypothetical protein